MNIIVVGRKQFGIDVAQLVHQHPFHELLGVVAPAGPSTPEFRGDRLSSWAEEHGILQFTPEFIEAARRDSELGIFVSQRGGLTLFLAVDAPFYLSAEFRAKARLGVLAYHPSLLPIHRGGDAIRWALHMRERITGGSWYWMDDGVDTGPIALQLPCLIDTADTPQTLWRRLQVLGLAMLDELLGLESWALEARRVDQQHELATWEPRINTPALARG